MSAQHIVEEFLADVRKFNKAVDSPSGDAEVDAACAMRDSALAMARELSTRDPQTAKLLEGFDPEKE
jgi:hypothetical protein